MVEVTLEFIGEQLKRLLDGQRLLAEGLEDVKLRLQRLERLTVERHGDVVRIDARLDRLEQRTGRIERRLDLVDG